MASSYPQGVSADEIDEAFATPRLCATCAHGLRDEDMDARERYCALIDDYVGEDFACAFWKEG